jgi:hypothetical protein
MFADKIWGDYKFHLVILLCCVLAELVGPIRIPLGGVTITLLPLLYSMIFVLVVYLIKPIKFVKEKQAATGSAMLTLSVAFLMAKLGITSGGSIEQVISAGPVLILQNLGNIGTLLVALPIALLLGMGREAVGMTHAMSREPNVALISDMFGADSAEFKGVMTCYIVGTIFGTIFMSIIPPLFVSLGIFTPEATAMAVGAIDDDSRPGRNYGSRAFCESGYTDRICKHQQRYIFLNLCLSGIIYHSTVGQCDL